MREGAERGGEFRSTAQYDVIQSRLKVLDLMTPTAQEGSTLDPPKILLAGQKK